MSATVIELEEVSFIRQGNQILSGINWQTYEGEHWVILGPNGAGKTTLASIVAGRNYPSKGKANILGETLGKVPIADIHQRVGFASSAILSKIPAGQKVENLITVAAYGTLVGVRGQEYDHLDGQRAKDLMRLFGVDELAQRNLGTLSDGERQRVLICRALMADPEILILDEPMAGVDLTARELLIGALDELTRDPRSPQIIMVTHHLEEIPTSFNRAMLLKDGKVLASGETTQVLKGENLQAAFSLPLKSGQGNDGRWWAHC